MKSQQDFSVELAELERAFSNLEPELELTVRDPEMKVEGYVVVWSTLAAKGGPLGRCGKGGTRITPHVSLDEVRMLAKIMTLKNSAAGLPLGGAKSGMKDDPDSPGFEQRYRRFVQLVKPVLHENGGIFGGFGFDIGARPQHPFWAIEELGSGRGFTGKPLDMGGTDYDREGLAGFGVAVAGRTALECAQKKISEATFAVQGAGAMGAAVIRYFTEYGGQLAYVSDPRLEGTFEINGTLDAKLRESLSNQDFEQTKKLLKEGGYRKLGLDDVLYQDVEVLFPCAVQDVITQFNAHKIKARFLIEAANNPCSDEARSIMTAREIFLVPDFIANPGGIVAAFVEMTSKATVEENVRTRRKVQEAKELTTAKITDNVQMMYSLAKEFDVEPAKAGRYLALRNIVWKGNR